MKATAQTHDVSTGFRSVTLLVEDLTPFPLGVQVELEVKQIEQPQPPENVVPIATATATETGSVVSETGNPTNTAVESCDICKGSGVVAVFPDGATEGVPTRCDLCRGTGMKNPPPLPTPTA